MPSAGGFVFNQAPTVADYPKTDFDWLGNLAAVYQQAKGQSIANQLGALELGGANREYQQRFGVQAPGQQQQYLPQQTNYTPQQIQPPNPGGLYGSILQQESGNRSNIGDSNRGAIGPGQITKGTWDRFAQPGEDIRNPDDNRRVSKRILDHYLEKYGDPARAAVAYFSGEGNVAPPGSPTPWKRNASDGGITTSEYVRQVMARTRGGETTTREARADQAEKDVQAELGGNRNGSTSSPAPVEQPPGAVGNAPFMAASSQQGAGPANVGGEQRILRASQDERAANAGDAGSPRGGVSVSINPSPTGPENRGTVPQGPATTTSPTRGQVDPENDPRVRNLNKAINTVATRMGTAGVLPGKLGASAQASDEATVRDLTKQRDELVSRLTREREMGLQTSEEKVRGQQAAAIETGKKEEQDQLQYLRDTGEAGLEARAQKGQLDAISQLGEQAPYGGLTRVKQLLSQYGVPTQGLTDIQAYEAAINFMAPQLRPPGSGRLMSNEMAGFKAALGGLLTTPEGRKIAISNLQLMHQYKMDIGKIARDHSLSPSDRMEKIAETPFPTLRTNTEGNKPGQEGAVAGKPPPGKYTWTPEGGIRPQ